MEHPVSSLSHILADQSDQPSNSAIVTHRHWINKLRPLLGEHRQLDLARMFSKRNHLWARRVELPLEYRSPLPHGPLSPQLCLSPYRQSFFTPSDSSNRLGRRLGLRHTSIVLHCPLILGNPLGCTD